MIKQEQKYNVYLIRGLPGAGKTTLAKSLNPMVICSADDYFYINGEYKFNINHIGRAHVECFQKFKTAVDVGCYTVCVANTFTRFKELKPYLDYLSADAFKRYQVHVLTVNNHHGSKDVHNVPDATINAMRERFEHF